MPFLYHAVSMVAFTFWAPLEGRAYLQELCISILSGLSGVYKQISLITYFLALSKLERKVDGECPAYGATSSLASFSAFFSLMSGAPLPQ